MGFGSEEIIYAILSLLTAMCGTNPRGTQENSSTKLSGGNIINGTATVPIWEKMNLTLNEAAEYSNIGVNKLREISNEDNCPFVLWIGNKRLIKRKLFDAYIERAYSI